MVQSRRNRFSPLRYEIVGYIFVCEKVVQRFSKVAGFFVYIYIIYRLGGPNRKIFSRGLKSGPSDVLKIEGK